MRVCAIVGSIGTGLLSTIDIGTSAAAWAAYLVVTGLGIGVGVQMPMTAVQVALA